MNIRLWAYCAMVLVLLSLTSCDEQCDGNFGDKSVKPTLVLDNEIKAYSGKTYQLEVENESDVTSPSGLVYHLVEMKQIILDVPADTCVISIKSNSLWKAPVPSVEAGRLSWMKNYNPMTKLSLTAGGGDGMITLAYESNENRKTQRKTIQTQMIYTADSTVMYKLTFGQYGTNGQ